MRCASGKPSIAACSAQFHYFGIGDGTDLRGIRFERGRYVSSDLEGVLTGDHVRAQRIMDTIQQWVMDPHRCGALGFCAGVQHARFMADQFNEWGYPSVALDGSTANDVRRDAVTKLRSGELRAIFTVDIFNESVDIPEVDTLLLLRPTESATIFLQQLGRGLRWSPGSGKSVLTVLDFIGQVHADYRFDIRYRAMLGGTRAQIARAVESGFPLMPPGCAVRLDEFAQDIVLENLKQAIENRRRGIIDDLRALPSNTSLAAFLDQSSFDLIDIYARPGTTSTFTAMRRAAGHIRDAPGSDEREFAKSLGRMLHINDNERLGHWKQWLSEDRPPPAAPVDSRDGRLQLMLYGLLGGGGQPVADMASVFGRLWASERMRAELLELLDVLSNAGLPATSPVDDLGPVPIHSHGTYTRLQAMAAYGFVSSGKLLETREGVAHSTVHNTDLFFVTLDKSGSGFSSTTSYNDYPISPTLFHWESQNRTSPTSPTGRRYISHVRSGSRIVLFVRELDESERKVASPFVCLGPARYKSHQSSKPMQITWELERPMPPEVYEYAKVAAG